MGCDGFRALRRAKADTRETGVGVGGRQAGGWWCAGTFVRRAPAGAWCLVLEARARSICVAGADRGQIVGLAEGVAMLEM